MRQTITLFAVFFLSSISSFGQSQAEKDAIKQLCGCFEVEFKYTETFSDHDDYEFHDPYSAAALEWVTLEEETNNKLVLQHILVINDTFFIKHWRQDWEYQPTDLFTYQGNKVWQANDYAPMDGQWSQEVYGVSDEPRYAGAATWFLADGKKVWESISNAPLPRRDYSKRDDYQIMRRTNGHVMHDWGWVHEQDNQKIVVNEDGSETVLVEEKGRNTYRRVDAENCVKAADWWKDKKDFWQLVRKDWDNYLASPGAFTVERKVDDVRFSRTMRDLQKMEFADETQAFETVSEKLSKYRTSVSTDKKSTNKSNP